MYGEGILNRFPEHSPLLDESNPFRRVFINTVGALLDDFKVEDSREGVYLQNASNVYLDMHGKDLGVKRKHDETDEHYRMRLIYETLGYLTVAYLLNVYELPLYSYVSGFDVDDNTLTSDNPYLRVSGGFMSVADSEIQGILESKFILGGGLTWLTL